MRCLFSCIPLLFLPKDSLILYKMLIDQDTTLKSVLVFGSYPHCQRSLSSALITRIFFGDKSPNQYSVTPATCVIIGKIKPPSSGQSVSLHELLLLGCTALQWELCFLPQRIIFLMHLSCLRRTSFNHGQWWLTTCMITAHNIMQLNIW